VFNSPMLHLLRVEMVINSPWMLSKNWLVKQMALGVHTPRSDEDRLKLMELMVFLATKELNPYIYISCIKQFWNTASVKRSADVTRFISPALTQKVFANMRRVGKGFSGVETPLFEGMLVARPPAKEGVAEVQVQADDVVAAAVQENVAEDGAEFPTQIQQVLNVCSALTKRIENLENDNAAQKLVIIKLKARVKRLEKANMVKSSKLRRLRKVGASRRIESSDDMEEVFNQGRMIDDMDKDEGIELVKDVDIAESEGRQQAEKQAEIYNLDLDHSSKVLSMQEDDSEVQEVVEVVTTAKLITDVVTAALQVSAASATISAAKPSIPAAAPTVVVAYTRRRKGVIIRDPKEELPLKTPAETPKVKDKGKVVAAYTRRKKGVIIRDPEEELSLKTPAETPKVKDKGKGILDETPKPMKKKDQIELDAEYARKKEMEEEDQEIIKSINETLEQKAAKRRKLSKEAQEAKDLRKRLEVVDDEDDDVFIEATPLARKVPVVDYQIVLRRSEEFVGIVKNIFSTSKPTNFSDEYLLLTLKTMFEKPDEQDAVWKNQKSVYGLALVKSWKLLTSCGVHIITLSTVQLILLVERRYPLSRFTLEQLVNVTRLQVEEESEMSLELLRFTRHQLQEYQQG
nr:hypothetical protein [Tanacetum cinerariifolium]